jgi:serpin B
MKAIGLMMALTGLVQPLSAQTVGGEQAHIVASPDEPSAEDMAAEAFIPASIDADGRAIVGGINSFSADLYRAIAGSKGNLAVSPASVSLAFALAHAGASGETKTDIARTLHYPAAVKDFDRSTGELLQSMQINARGRTMAINNAIWLQQGLPVHASYLTLVEQHYGAGLQRVDYIADPNAARKKINDWVAEKTRGKILDLLAPSHITDDTKSVLVNTIYFKADWAQTFAKEATKIGNFNTLSGKKNRIPLMRQREHFRFAESAGVKAISLPYRGGETEMMVLLPKDGRGLAGLEQSLTGEKLADWSTRLQNSGAPEVILTLPKFKIEKSFELVPVLQKMGMKVPFTDRSDFSAMKPIKLGSADPNDWNLKISNVVHKVFVEVEEKGTEAAAATAVIQVVVTSAPLNPSPPPPPKIFKADHPFLFAIRDVRTGAIVFLGRFEGAKVQ